MGKWVGCFHWSSFKVPARPYHDSLPGLLQNVSLKYGAGIKYLYGKSFILDIFYNFIL